MFLASIYHFIQESPSFRLSVKGKNENSEVVIFS